MNCRRSLTFPPYFGCVGRPDLDLDQQPATVFDTLEDGTVRVRFDKEHLGEAIVGAGQLGVVSFTPPVVASVVSCQFWMFVTCSMGCLVCFDGLLCDCISCLVGWSLAMFIHF